MWEKSEKTFLGEVLQGGLLCLGEVTEKARFPVEKREIAWKSELSYMGKWRNLGK